MSLMQHFAHTSFPEKFEKAISLMQLPNEPRMLYEPISYALGEGGKRMRPTLLLLAYNIFRDDIQNAMEAALAVEIFHNFTLLHDDIMDHADVRRGRPSVPAKWNENIAILSGDAMLIEAYTHLQMCSGDVLPEVMKRFNTMAVEVCEGQQYDMDFETQQKVSVVEYMHMIGLKTSALLAGSVAIGAILAGAKKEDVDLLYNFAMELGLAFQLQDDLLDSYGDARLGKKIGGDILEGKKTFLMITALSHASESDREILRTTHLRTDISDEEKISTVKEVYDRLDARHQTEQQIAIHISKAVSILEGISVGKEHVAEMSAYALSLVGRNS